MMKLSLARASHTSRLAHAGEGSAPVQPEVHHSVMTKEVLAALNLKAGELVVDATLGQGGHSEALLAHSDAQVLALDADPGAIALATKRLAPYKSRVRMVESNFSELEHVLASARTPLINAALFDLGWNSGQLASGRGFSFLIDEPLSMSYGKVPASGFTAAEALNLWDEKTLADVFFGYGEERYAKRIAKAIVERRRVAAIATSLELAEIVRDSVPPTYRHGRIHPATRTFQSLRIAVNDELRVIEKGLTAAWAHLAPGGRIVVISFHSIEDRLVKQLFARFAKGGGVLIYKKPLVPSQSEVRQNPRARSAKVRAIQKN